ncbi:Flp pilus assembly protein CpaB [Sphingomonas astaxanthinifaciens]|uniref:Flp pilus assembly protein CpaB n=1 Tax=Sphingomonas astaxanthinifaciens TaxID=407019 RepID=UPI0006897A74|nr:Flp pilus assembly protein CpaB [Sphingomonas astaxanthinifaciens]
MAVILGLVAVYLANIYLTSRAGNDQRTPEGMARVAVAAVPLGYGTELTADKIRFAEFPTSAIPAGTFRTADELLVPGERRVVIRPMEVNEPILGSKISGKGQGASIAATLPDGRRAATVRINDVSGVAGFIQPNDSVDVLITRQNQTGQQVTDVLLQNIRVIAMGQQANNETGQPVVASTATLEVVPIDAQKLALGQQAGTLSLVLRKPGQQEDIAGVKTVSLSDLRYSIYGAAPYNNGNAAAPAQPKPVVRVIRQPAPRPRPVATAPAAPPRPTGSSVQVVRGTAGSDYQVGDYAGGR